MYQRLQKIAIGLWLLSLVLPTVQIDHGKYFFGAQVMAKGLFAIFFFPFSLAFPLHILSVLTNFIFIIGMQAFTAPTSKYSSIPSSVIVSCALILNIYVGIYALLNKSSPLPALFSLPGYYVWISAFALLLVTRLLENKA